MRTALLLLLVITSLSLPVTSFGQKTYAPAKVIYDVSSANPAQLNAILDRVSLLQRVYGNDTFEASIIIVVHEGAIPLFARGNKTHASLMQRAASLVLDDIIQFRLCLASARMQGFKDNDFYAFAQMVPMADAEIVELQNKGYAYLR